MKRKSTKPRGFALIATILLMVLLAIITVGTLSLSVVTLRNGAQDSALAKARANARMALMIAVAELQKQMGPDQRISANSSILSDSSVTNGHWLGVWNSWKAGNGEASQHSTIVDVSDEMAPTYLPNRSDYFREWLVCLNNDEKSNITSPSDLTLNASPLPGADDDAILLVAKGSLGDDPSKASDYVAARLLNIKDQATSQITGRYSWWVGDESQKSRIMADSYNKKTSLTSAEKIFRSQAPGSTGTKSFVDLDDLNAAQEARLEGLPSLKTLDVLVDDDEKHPAQKNFHSMSAFSNSLLTDVREGGLKRDLSVLLEQPIDRTDSGTEYMLYEFDDPRFPGDRSHSRVPIQDLAAYYQLYDHTANHSNNRREGVQFNSTKLPDSIQIRVPDYDGGTMNRQRYLREYTSLYRQPVVAKIQFLLAAGAQPITEKDRQDVLNRIASGKNVIKPVRDSDTHKLRVGIIPMITMWNPNNIPLVFDRAQLLRFGAPPFALRWKKYRASGPDYTSLYFNLYYAMGSADSNDAGGGHINMPHLMKFRFANTVAQQLVFEPGEVKVFSVPSSKGGSLKNGGNAFNFAKDGDQFIIDPVNSWDPFGFFLTVNSAAEGSKGNQSPDVCNFKNASGNGWEASMVFESGDSVAFEVVTEGDDSPGRRVTQGAEVYGAGFQFAMMDAGYYPPTKASDFLRHYQMLSANASRWNATGRNLSYAFNTALLTPGFPGGKAPIAFESETNAILGSQLINAMGTDEVIGLMEFSLSVGCESGAAAVGGFGGGRRIASRPFLHSSPSVAPYIDRADRKNLYNYGWDWQLGTVNNVEDSIIQADPGTGNGFHGGGYTIEAGTTHVVQRDLPVLPPMSIASLSHAQLGGYSLAYAAAMGDDPDADQYWWKIERMRYPSQILGSTDYQKVTATGQGGLAPQVSQAIGNSYAHPNISSNKAYTTWSRKFFHQRAASLVPFADHSYLANKALWDEFFFSSLSPQLAKVQLFEAPTKPAQQVLNDFFLKNVPLPNRRVQAYKKGIDQTYLDTLYAEYGNYSDGMADKIAAHLMIEGGFNINSTSVEAWKVIFSSLRDKPVAYLDGGKVPKEAVSAADKPGTLVAPGMLPGAAPIYSADIVSPNEPSDQWKAGRFITDEEIEKLAEAMVKQVKKRGPFLSLSEFVNRRLAANDTDNLALKGALQAALDDDSVTINANFRTAFRTLDAEMAANDIATGQPVKNAFAFPDAADGPIAYGSQAYVDQADVLRGLAAQLTPRGDTFVIRTYGDALDANGNVMARAWCEAVVQRLPDYVDNTDENHLKTASLESVTNQRFGRSFVVLTFRWLHPDEI